MELYDKNYNYINVGFLIIISKRVGMIREAVSI